ncbi:MAG: tRNA (N(6)-L-threonylcarbamoyladenosine(37)-C(2))-methylthiotransferase MtaB [Firmicutes bacterium]|nr:tRNA (N(6)-L-threonylcarbamoyladenosine(37)-C(2))-methylthiotransferase MtaB [Bacillota bacterium]
MRNIFVTAHTLGCKVNQCDTEAVLELLVKQITVCKICNFNENADIYVINTCTVTHASDKKSRQIIRRARKQNPNAIVAVCGCMALSNPAAAKELGVDFVFDARKPETFIDYIQQIFGDTANTLSISNGAGTLRTRTRAFVKIQDGCDRFCAYCIVPYVRGNPKSRPVPDILNEITGLVADGVQEIVLTGIQVASYGEDTNDTNLSALITKISSTDSLKRLRLSSIEPYAVTDEFLAVAASSQVLCDHFHLSLQSGCNATLQRMNRRYTTAEYAKIVEQLREINPNIALTTDIIVGFPGETDEEFNQSMVFVKQVGFARIHVFEYSKREGTAAANFPGQVPDKTKTERSKQMRDLAALLQTNFYRRQIGKTVPVLFENSKKQNKWVGYTSNYCPVEVYCEINLSNIICQVKITALTQDGLEGVYKQGGRKK